jgi:glyoxylate reductase
MLHEACDVEVWPGELPPPRNVLLEKVRDVDGLLSLLTDKVDDELLDAAPKLRVVANLAVGFDNIDVDACTRRGVLCGNTPGVLTETTADFAFALLMSAARRVVEGDRYTREGRWRTWGPLLLLGQDVHHSTLGLIGLGRIGRAVAARASAFGARVAYTSHREGDSRWERLSFDRLLNTSDIVSLHVPLTQETEHLIDKRAFARMKRSAYLINTSRGPVVDEEALAWALGEHLIAGAALDVYEHEPKVQTDLLKLENVILVPHLGSATTETRTAMADLAVANVLAVLSGKPPLTPIP